MKNNILTVLCLLFGTTMVQAAEYNIVDFGAVADTTFLSTSALQQAIDKCSGNGGGRVMVPAGYYKIGTVVMKSGVELYLENGATLFGSTDLKDYIPMKTDYVSLRTQSTTIQLIYADKAKNITIDGYGTIDGRGATFKKRSWNDEGITRPHLLRMVQCQDVNLKGVTLRNAGCWMQHWLACDRVRIDGITVVNRNNYNNDALDLDGCHDVTVNNMIADSDDDGITLKSTSPRLCENIAITNCVVSSHCNAIKLGTETNGGFKNVNISNCVVKPSYDQSSKLYGESIGTSAISLEIVDGGVMENVLVSGIVVEGTESPIFIRLGNRARSYCTDKVINHVGTINGVRISNVMINNAGPTGCSITGLPGHPIENVQLDNISIIQAGGQAKIASPQDEKEKEYPEATMWGMLPAKGFYVRHARNVNMRNVTVRTLNADKRPAFVYEDAE